MRVEPSRVAVLVDLLQPGGAERLAVELACALDRSRFDPHVIVSRQTGPLERLLEDAEVPFTVLDRTNRLQIHRWHRAHAVVRRSHLLHAHKFGSNVWGALLARTTGVPLVAHEHNFAATASRSRAVIDRRWIAPVASRVVCVSDSVAEVERSIGVPQERLEVIPNGVRLEAAWPRASARDELGLAHDELVVGIVGLLRPEKAHEILFEALATVRAHGLPARVCVVGDGPRRAELEQLAAQLGVAEHVVWAGLRPDAARLAAAFDVSVLCSHWEGLPLAALEAMAAGVPLVASSVGGLPDLAAGGAAVLTPPGDVAALASALTDLLASPERARALGAVGQRRVRDSYGFRRMVARVEALYSEVLAERSGMSALLAEAQPSRRARGAKNGRGEAA